MAPAPAPRRTGDDWLVTGAAGFVGARTAQALLEAGHRVVGIDVVNDTTPRRLKDWRLANLQRNPNFSFHSVDLADGAAVAKALGQRRFAAAIHLAARAGVRASVENPAAYIRDNVLATSTLLDWCGRAGVERVVVASSSSVYGNAPLPFREDQAADRPLSPYAATKRASEMLAHAAHALHGIHVAVVRFFTVYGPAGRTDMSPMKLVDALVNGHTFPLYGDGSQTRDWTYVDDIARGAILAAGTKGFEVFNLGSQRPETLARVVEILEGLTGRRLKAQKLPRHGADVEATLSDSSKAQRLLGWNAEVPLEKGLARLVEWHAAQADLMRAIHAPLA